jgi:hypothetical protein
MNYQYEFDKRMNDGKYPGRVNPPFGDDVATKKADRFPNGMSKLPASNFGPHCEHNFF